MKKLVSTILVAVFALSFMAGITVSKAESAVPVCAKIECRYSPFFGDYYWWCCESATTKGKKGGPIVYGDCYFLYDLDPCH